MNSKNKKSCLTEEEDHQDVKNAAENAVHLVLILSLAAVLACSIRWEHQSKTKIELELRVDSTSTLINTNQRQKYK